VAARAASPDAEVDRFAGTNRLDTAIKAALHIPSS